VAERTKAAAAAAAANARKRTEIRERDAAREREVLEVRQANLLALKKQMRAKELRRQSALHAVLRAKCARASAQVDELIAEAERVKASKERERKEAAEHKARTGRSLEEEQQRQLAGLEAEVRALFAQVAAEATTNQRLRGELGESQVSRFGEHGNELVAAREALDAQLALLQTEQAALKAGLKAQEDSQSGEVQERERRARQEHELEEEIRAMRSELRGLRHSSNAARLAYQHDAAAAKGTGSPALAAQGYSGGDASAIEAHRLRTENKRLHAAISQLEAATKGLAPSAPSQVTALPAAATSPRARRLTQALSLQDKARTELEAQREALLKLHDQAMLTTKRRVSAFKQRAVEVQIERIKLESHLRKLEEDERAAALERAFIRKVRSDEQREAVAALAAHESGKLVLSTSAAAAQQLEAA
jgi:hypothetical protein